MKRRNVQLAFIGEGISDGVDAAESTEELMRGDEAIDLTVTGGTIVVVVPAGTPDEEIFNKVSILDGELILENGLRLTFEIKDGAVGAQFLASHEQAGEQEHVGLSTIPRVPGGA